MCLLSSIDSASTVRPVAHRCSLLSALCCWFLRCLRHSSHMALVHKLYASRGVQHQHHWMPRRPASLALHVANFAWLSAPTAAATKSTSEDMRLPLHHLAGRRIRILQSASGRALPFAALCCRTIFSLTSDQRRHLCIQTAPQVVFVLAALSGHSWLTHIVILLFLHPCGPSTT